MKKYLIGICFLLFGILSHAQPEPATKLESDRFKRLYMVSDSLYRSEQPGRKGFKEIEAIGIKTILNLRRLKEDDRKARDTKLNLQHLRLKSKEIDEADILSALQIIKDSEKPVLVHCWHGSDRTGVVIAAYRIVFENWPKEEAIAELRQPEFGHHENWYPNIVELLNELNAEKLRSKLGLE